ncbi:MAG: fibronectin type III domain-containing protein, partial [Patescibacteria group bacterium]
SNIRVTDVTQNSAIVRWTTNLGASSRVIYDTASHANLGEAPNYGYANSTETIDTGAGVTEHAVTLTGLSPATTYYFRVISER